MDPLPVRWRNQSGNCNDNDCNIAHLHVNPLKTAALVVQIVDSPDTETGTSGACPPPFSIIAYSYGRQHAFRSTNGPTVVPWANPCGRCLTLSVAFPRILGCVTQLRPADLPSSTT